MKSIVTTIILCLAGYLLAGAFMASAAESTAVGREASAINAAVAASK